MQIPPLEAFRQDEGLGYGRPWWVDPEGATFTLTLPDDDATWNNDDWPRPHEPSYQMAARVLPELPTLVDKAVKYLEAVVDPVKAGMVGDPYLTHVACDARKESVVLEMAWETDVYASWSVTFSWREGEGDAPRWCWPAAMGFRSR